MFLVSQYLTSLFCAQIVLFTIQVCLPFTKLRLLCVASPTLASHVLHPVYHTISCDRLPRRLPRRLPLFLSNIATVPHPFASPPRV